MIKSRDRVEVAVRHQEPDRVPLDIWIREDVMRQLQKYVNVTDREEVLQYLGVDMRMVEASPGFNFLQKGAFFHPRGKWVIKKKEGVYEDEWGIQYFADRSNRYFGVLRHPLANASSLRNYDFPDIDDPTRFKVVESYISKFGDNYSIVASVPVGTLFDPAGHLRGYERLMIDLIENSHIGQQLLDKLLELREREYKKYVELGVDMILLGDDFGTQDRMLINPDLWRKYFKPRMQELISSCKQGHQVYIAYHSDGYIEPIIEDLIDIGVDILNPIQPESMDPVKIKKEYGNRLVLYGTISIQSTLLKGTTEDVKQRVKEIINICGTGGGLIVAPTNMIQPDTPMENIVTMYRTAQEYRK